MKVKSVIGVLVFVFFACYVLFGVRDPKELYDGFLTLIQKIADKGQWVKDAWSMIAEGDLSGIWQLIKNTFFDSMGVAGWLGGLFK